MCHDCCPPACRFDAGTQVLASGGNAFHAALACACVQFVVDPHSCGVGGYLIMHHKQAGRESVCAEVRKKHPLSRLPYSYGELALVHAIAIEAGQELKGAADAGADGMALLVPDRIAATGRRG